MRSWYDATGGKDNLLMFKKDGIGVRVYQAPFGTGSAYSSSKDLAFTDATNASGNWPTASYAITASYVQLAPGSQVLFSTTGSWTVTPGSNTYTFTVDQGATYTMWVYGNIPNGIIGWNATATISNNNVPVVGTQYAWVYTGGGSPLDLVAIPNNFIGTAGTIVKTAGGGVTLPTNTFRFTINNTSGANQTVFYGFTKL
jgi:hypothetical protein